MMYLHSARKPLQLRLKYKAQLTSSKAKELRPKERLVSAITGYLVRPDLEYSGRAIHVHWRMILQDKRRVGVNFLSVPGKFTRWRGFWRMKDWKVERSRGNNWCLRWDWAYLRLRLGGQWAQWTCQRGWQSPKSAANRVEYATVMLQRHPEPEDWDRVRFSDEVHFGWGAQRQLRIIRKPGERYCITCIQHKEKPKAKDEK